MTRRRVLSEDERALWESVAKQARPLRKRTRLTKAETVVTAEPPPRTSARRSANESAPPPGKPAAMKPPPSPPLVPLARRERAHLSRGRIEIDARLDLHGMTQARAHGALLRFLQRASGDGLRFVLVVTGKGNSAAPRSERGVLRRQVPEWLSLPEFRAFVIGFEEAHIGHGGGGALYVRVRRGR
ncbi:MAG: Smr/MutS family protein [Xanthobacteraceae bacterium]|nr:Smr/MutS family protein [Xanthobacteraceae bacterium]